MATTMQYPLNTLGRKAVTCYAKFQFSGSGGVTAFTGSGVRSVSLSGTTYTAVFESAWPQVAKLGAQLLLSPTYVGTVSGGLDVVFNGAQLAQLSTLYTGSTTFWSGSGMSQTIDFSVQGSNNQAVTPPYLSGSNWCMLEATFFNQNFR